MSRLKDSLKRQLDEAIDGLIETAEEMYPDEPEIRKRAMAQLGQKLYARALEIASGDEDISPSEVRELARDFELYVDQVFREKIGFGILQKET